MKNTQMYDDMGVGTAPSFMRRCTTMDGREGGLASARPTEPDYTELYAKVY